MQQTFIYKLDSFLGRKVVLVEKQGEISICIPSTAGASSKIATFPILETVMIGDCIINRGFVVDDSIHLYTNKGTFVHEF